jgi:RNA polymerase sigma factor (sigma-70 family)
MNRRASSPDDRGLAGEAAFTAFYRANAGRLLAYFTRRTYDAEVALDLTAETFAEAFRRRAAFRDDGRGEAERRWLFGIGKRILLRYYRRGRVERAAIERLGLELPRLSAVEQQQIEQQAGLDELRAVLDASLQELSPDQRDALRLRVVDDLPYATVARRLGVSEPTARARVSRGLRVLGRALGPLHAKRLLPRLEDR